MINPLVKYKEYHKNKTNIIIHQGCVPLLLLSIYSILPIYCSISANIFYSATYLLFDVFSTKSIHSFYYLQSIFLLHFVFRQYFSLQTNACIHAASWILQIIGHKMFENNTPAFLENLYDSFLFAPYFTFLETFYPASFEVKAKYTILKPEYDASKKSILYFAGLFQKAELAYKNISNDLLGYNHIYINTNFSNHDVYKDTLAKIMDDLDEVDIECLVGFSFGGSLSLQLKELYREKKNKDLKCVLISPGGFQSNTFVAKSIEFISKYLYSLYKNDKWYMIRNYPIYQNTNSLSNTDYIISSINDTIHHPRMIQMHTNIIVFKHASHLTMISVVKKQKILSQLINQNYRIDSVQTKPLSSTMNKLLFGGHFFPYHITLWLSVSVYNLYTFFQYKYSIANFLYGFVFASTISSFTEYMFHRFLLHRILYAHHKKHHVYPNKMSIINTPMSMVILTWVFYYFVLNLFINEQIIKSYYIFMTLHYLSFEITHLLSHSYKGANTIILNAKYYHKLHHIDETVNFSFITPFWDYVFGTLSPKYKVSFEELVFGFIPYYSFCLRKYTEQ